MPNDASTEAASRGGSRVVTPVSINVIESANQELYLFGVLNKEEREQQPVHHTEEQVVEEHQG